MKGRDTLYARWLSGDLSSEELQQLKSSGELEQLEAIVKSMEQLQLPNYDKEAAFKKLKEKRQKKPVAKVVGMPIRWMIAAAASLILLAVAWFLMRPSPEARFMAQNGSNQTFDLVDGSEVILNDGSEIIYNPKDWKNSRQVKLKGEAVFDVEKGSDFVVQTQNGTVRVLGTRFNVRAWGSNLYVECYHGKVEVRSKGQQTILTPNEAINVVNGKMQDEQLIQHKEPLWIGGSSRFYKESIQEVFAEIERQFDVKVRHTQKQRSFSGSFQHDDLEAALKNICKPLGIRYTILDDKKEILIE